MDVAVTKYSGEKTGRKVTLSDEVFGIEPNDHAIWLDVKSHLANKRQGNHHEGEWIQWVGETLMQLGRQLPTVEIDNYVSTFEAAVIENRHGRKAQHTEHRITVWVTFFRKNRYVRRPHRNRLVSAKFASFAMRRRLGRSK